MKMLRQILFWTHLVIGLGCAVVVMMLALTGVLLTYEPQIHEQANTSLRADVPADAQRLPIEQTLVRASQEHNLRTRRILMPRDPGEPVHIIYDRNENVFINSVTNEVTEKPETSGTIFMEYVRQLHRWLLMPEGDARWWGRFVTGSANLGFFLLILSGLYLWLPRRWTWLAFRQVIWFRRGLRARLRDWNWHNTIGVWCAVPLMLIVISGATIGSFAWVDNGFEAMFKPTQPANPNPPEQKEPQAIAWRNIGAAMEVAKARVPDWQMLSIPMPLRSDSLVEVMVDTSNSRQPQYQQTFWIDRSTGEVQRTQTFGERDADQRVHSFLRFAHTGEIGGIFTQTLAGLASLGCAVLVWTGLSLSYRRFTRVQRPRRIAASRPEPIASGSD